jgi:hypothetical protein
MGFHVTDLPSAQLPEDSTPSPRRRRRWPFIVGAGVIVVALCAGGAVFAESQVSIDGGSQALAGVNLPPGTSVTSISAVDQHGNPLPLTRSGTSVVPVHPLAPGTPVTVQATVRYSAPASWIFGSSKSVTATITTPQATVVSPAVQTVPSGHAVLVSFDTPVARAAVTSGGVQTTVLHRGGVAAIHVPHAATNGTAQISAVPRTWETLPPAVLVAWFAPAAKTQVLGSPNSGAPITPYTPLVLTYSRPVAQVPGALHAPISQHVAGHWHVVNTHTVVFSPSGAGFAPDSHVTVTLPAGTELAGAPTRSVTWTVAQPSPLRAQQLLAELGYLPLAFTASTPVAATQQAQVDAVFAPPSGRYTWRWAGTPKLLRTTWTTNPAVVVRGALMAFEDQHGMSTDGTLGPRTWQSLIQATLARQRNTFGYTFVAVNKNVPQRLSLWHNGKVLLTPLVNTGIASAQTASGVYPVYLREKSGTMSGTNPDGTKYHDTGIPWISYFHGGDALHGFLRGSYGVPQSLGCVEMPYATAGAVWPWTPLGTLVDVE